MLIETQEQALQALALVKWFKDTTAQQVKNVEEQARNLLARTMIAGDRRIAAVNGESIATISLSKPSYTYEVTNEEEYAQWLLEHDIPVTWEQHLARHHTNPTHVKNLVEAYAPDEFPAGVKEREKAPFISTRMSQEQQDTLSHTIASLTDLTAAMGLTQLEENK